MCCDYLANSFALGWDVHRRTVRSLVFLRNPFGDITENHESPLLFPGPWYRFMIGFGLTFAASAAPVLITEIAYPSQRGPATSLYNSLWFLGSIMWVFSNIVLAMVFELTGMFSSQCCVDRKLPQNFASIHILTCHIFIQTYGTFHVPSSWAWRIPSAIQGLPSVCQVFLIWFVPESPRWLCNKGRYVLYLSMVSLLS